MAFADFSGYLIASLQTFATIMGSASPFANIFTVLRIS
jgi:hypothetical protein